MQNTDGTSAPIADVVEYQGWNKVFKLCNDTIQLLILADVGPRILFFGFRREPNEFYEKPEHAGKCGGEEYRVYGGHRLWVSPEVHSTYYPDNAAVDVCRYQDAYIFRAPPESHPDRTLQKEVEVKLAESGAHVSVTHRISNVGKQTTEIAPWALSVMAGGGKAILPLPERAPASKDRLLPEGVFALWTWTDLADRRWRLGTKYIQLQQEKDSGGTFNEQMGGIYSPFGWCAYFRQGHLFVKTVKVYKGSKYPDFGCNFEVYTDAHSLELETLGPLQTLQPGQTAEHSEGWWLFKDIPAGEDETWIDGLILKAVETTKLVELG
jgi:hypothetical protein